MTLTVHHLKVSQSERIVWLCEELKIPYSLVLHHRDPLLSPQSIKDLNPLGQAPVIQEGDLTLSESGACAEYIIAKHGNGRLKLAPSHENYSDQLYWFHFANSNLQPAIFLLMHVAFMKQTSHPYVRGLEERLSKVLTLLDARLASNDWLAGEEFTIADIMTVFSLTTGRMFYPLDLSAYSGILAWLKRVSEREAFRAMRAKADPELPLMIEGPPPTSFIELASKQDSKAKV